MKLPTDIEFDDIKINLSSNSNEITIFSNTHKTLNLRNGNQYNSSYCFLSPQIKLYESLYLHYLEIISPIHNMPTKYEWVSVDLNNDNKSIENFKHIYVDRGGLDKLKIFRQTNPTKNIMFKAESLNIDELKKYAYYADIIHIPKDLLNKITKFSDINSNSELYIINECIRAIKTVKNAKICVPDFGNIHKNIKLLCLGADLIMLDEMVKGHPGILGQVNIVGLQYNHYIGHTEINKDYFKFSFNGNIEFSNTMPKNLNFKDIINFERYPDAHVEYEDGSKYPIELLSETIDRFNNHLGSILFNIESRNISDAELIIK